MNVAIYQPAPDFRTTLLAVASSVGVPFARLPPENIHATDEAIQEAYRKAYLEPLRRRSKPWMRRRLYRILN